MIPPFGTGSAGDNGLYGGQLQPCGVFFAALAVVLAYDFQEHRATSEGQAAMASIIWGLFLRGLALTYLISFASLRGQIVGLSGAHGLFPAAAMLRRVRLDFPRDRFWRWVHFPAGWLWLSCSDAALHATCFAGMLVSALAAFGVGSGLSPLLFMSAYCIWIMLSTASNATLGYPWDCLLAEMGLLCGLLLPPLAPLDFGSGASLGCAGGVVPCRSAVWSVRLLLVKVVLGMGKMKFSQGWAHPDNRLYLKHFLSWQPLPTPVARWAQVGLGRLMLPDQLWVAMHYAMWVAEVPIPALFLSSSLTLRTLAAISTIALQVGIQLSGNYGTFNVLTALLALPLLASDALMPPTAEGLIGAAEGLSGAAGAGAVVPGFAVEQDSPLRVLAAVALALLSLIHFPHNSYTTNAWPFLPDEQLVTSMQPCSLQPVLRVLLAACRALAPWHISHAYGVFTPRALRDCTSARRVLRIQQSFDDGRTWQEVTTRYNPCASVLAGSQGHPASPSSTRRLPRDRQALHFFAPTQPRLDHHLFYESFEIDLQLTAQTNPYFSGSSFLLPRLAQRLAEQVPSVCALLRFLPTTAPRSAPPAGLVPTSEVTQVQVDRSWVRFATPGEFAATGVIWVDVDNKPKSTYGASRIRDEFRVAPNASMAQPRRAQPSTELPPFEDLPKLEGWWLDLAHQKANERILPSATEARRTGREDINQSADATPSDEDGQVQDKMVKMDAMILNHQSYSIK